MNNDIIKSLRRTLLRTVAAAAVAIGFTACSDEIFTAQNTTAPTNGNGYKVIIPSSMGGGDTRAIAYSSETGGYDETFELSDRIYVYNNKLEKWSDEPLKPDSEGKSANMVGLLNFYSEDIAEGDELMLCYKDSYFNYDRDFSFGTSLSDYSVATVTITSISDGVIKTSAAIFKNLQSVYKIDFTGIASGVKIKKVYIESEQRKLVNSYSPTSKEGPNYFGQVTYTFEKEGAGLSEMIFLLRFADNPYNQNESGTPSTSDDVITFRALGSDGHYYVGTKRVTNKLIDSQYYQAEVAMADAGLALTLTNNTTGELVVPTDQWTPVSTKDAGYTVTNTGINTSLSWYGGDQTLTLKNVTVLNSNQNSFIDALSDDEDLDNTKVHKLVLDGVNTLNSGIWLGSYRSDISLFISASPEGGSLTITQGGFSLGENGVLIIESGEVSVDYLYYNNDDNNSVILSGKDAKLRVRGNYSIIKAASGYVLNTATEGDYVVYTVKEAPAPKDLSTVTTADLGSIVCSDGKVYVPNCGLPEGVSTVGMIANISSTGHGLAVAMSKIKVRKDFDDGGWTTYEYFSWDDSAEYNNGKTATDIFNDWSSNNSVTFGTWRIATKEDCQNMILSCRIDGDATEASDNNMISNGFKSKLIEAGIIYDDYLYCWTNTTVDNDWRFYMSLERNGEDSIANFYTTDNSATSSILPVLEF